jgi:hypothetical protein
MRRPRVWLLRSVHTKGGVVDESNVLMTQDLDSGLLRFFCSGFGPTADDWQAPEGRFWVNMTEFHREPGIGELTHGGIKWTTSDS